MDDARVLMDERVVRIPRLGTKICMMAGALLLVVALYFALVPLRVEVSTGGTWDCGNSFSQPSKENGGGFCGKTNDIYLLRAGAFAVGALIVGIGGFLTFGADTRVEKRVRRLADDDI